MDKYDAIREEVEGLKNFFFAAAEGSGQSGDNPRFITALLSPRSGKTRYSSLATIFLIISLIDTSLRRREFF
jgi:hypothetical protein